MSLRAASVSFAWPGQTELLRDVSLELARGELLALVGANGSGKSTLLRVLAGLLEPRSGEVSLSGEGLGALGPRERARRLAFLPQRVRPLYPMTVREMVELARHPWGDAGTAAIEVALEQCDVADLAKRRFDELSGGERQRVLLAGVLAQGGDVLLLDEPTAALDLPHAVSVFARLRDQLEDSRGALVVTHDLNLAAAWADRILLLHAGGILAQGAPADVLRQDVLDRALGPGAEVIRHPETGAPCVLPASRRGAS
jgi:iron complex transport system ATP-binding protein